MKGNLPVDAARIAADIDALAALTEPDRPWTRRVFSPLYAQGRSFLEGRMRAAGLEPRVDAAGNLIGHRAGTDGGARGLLMLGSHSDTVPDGGRFDGVAGVVAALEVARALADRGMELRHDLAVVDFLAEEVSPFGVSCIGSRGMTGRLPPEWLDRAGADGDLRAAIRSVGGAPARLSGPVQPEIAVFLELHIEQGPVLEAERVDIGIVTAIAGISRFEIRVEGRADHAGTTPMGARADALVAASRLVLAIEAKAAELAAMPGHFTATVGEFRIEPNAANVVPARARLLVDARAEHCQAMAAFAAWLDATCAAMSQDGGVAVGPVARLSANDPTPADTRLLDHLEAACGRVGASARRMASGAGHDAAWIAKVAPAAMLFVPSRDGRSHAPDEWTETGALALGTAVLYEAVLALDRSLA